MKRIKINGIYFLALFCLMGLYACESGLIDKEEYNNSQGAATKALELIEKTVTVEEPGTLIDQLTEDEMKRVEKLIIKGKLNARDVTTFRTKYPEIQVLNLENVTFIENDTLTYQGVEWNPYWQNYYDASYKINKSAISASMFANMYKLISVTLPKSITELHAYAFFNCKVLTSVTFPEHIRKVGYEVFKGCSSLVSLDLSCFEELGSNMFVNCTQLESVIWPATLRIIPSHCFDNIKGPKIELPSSIVEIGEQAFARSKLSTIDVPSTVKTFGKAVFYQCVNLERISLTSELTKLPNSMFAECSSLKDIVLPETLIEIGEGAFQDAGLVSINMPGSITRISNNAFRGCPLTGEVFLPSSLLTIDRGAFEYCSFETINLPDKVESIEDSFGHNDNLKSITIPSSVKSVGGGLVSYCQNITSIFWNANANVPDVFSWGGVVSPNCLLYLANEEVNTAGASYLNKVVNGKIDKLVLTDGYPFCCPKEFKAREIVFKHSFQKTTVPGESQGWYTLVVPFDVQSITYNGAPISPFGKKDDNLNFWLRSLTSNGYKDEQAIEKNKPYIIAMPYNTEYYDDQFNIQGEVIFSAKNNAGITIPISSDLTPMKGPDYSLLGTYSYVPPKVSVYPIDEQGSAFVSSRRQTYPFEAYAINNSLDNSTRSFSLGNSGLTRAYRPVGRKPSITDM